MKLRHMNLTKSDKFQLKRLDILIPFLLFTTAVLLLFFCYTGNDRIFGAYTDWFNQHSVFPAYFRNLFYQTGRLFPEFAFSIGGGQNIYHFAYYGFANPLILLSYLFPFLKMEYYLIGISLIGLVADAFLCYYWLSKKGFRREISLFCALFMIMALPALYHAAKHLMFINYMPFLLLALIGFDRHEKRDGFLLYLAGVFLMILCSFYFAIGGILVLAVYGLSGFFTQPPKKLSAWIPELFRLYFPVILAVLLSLFYLLPVLFTMIGGRSSSQTYSLKKLLFPSFLPQKVIYSSYGLGLSAIALVILFTGLFYKKSREKFLSWMIAILLSFPVFCWLLNGGLYLKLKVFIPFLPLFCLLYASYLEKMKDRLLPCWKIFAGYGLAFSILFLERKSFSYSRIWILYIDFLLIGIILFLYWRFQIARLLMLQILLIMALLQYFQISDYHKLLIKNTTFQEVTNSQIASSLQKVLEDETEEVRTDNLSTNTKQTYHVNRVYTPLQRLTSCYSSILNSNYMDFRKQAFYLGKYTKNKLVAEPSSNPLFQRFMGVKYLVSIDSAEEKEPYGYEKIQSEHGINIYKNNKVSPIAYVTNHTISEEEYKKLPFPYRQTILLQQAVVKQGASETANYKKFKEASLELPEIQRERFSITKDGDKYRIHVKKKTTLFLPLSETTTEDSLLFVRFRVTNRKRNKSINIQVNDQWNKLSLYRYAYYNNNRYFSYTTELEKGRRVVKITLKKGDYIIDRMTSYLAPVSSFNSQSLYGDSVHFQQKKGTDNQFEANFTAEKNSHFITTLPYDKGFQVFIDGNEVPAERVNLDFLGFTVPDGHHSVQIVYHAPGRRLGSAGSLIGVLILILMILLF